MKILTPHDDLNTIPEDELKVFLAGGMGTPWRKELIDKLESLGDMEIVIIDPSVDDWENQVGEESADNEKYVKQTDWEQQGLGLSDVQVFHFDKSSISPISLFELGMFQTPNTIICLKDGYEKSGYIEYMSKRFSYPIETSIDALAKLIQLKYHTLRK